MNNAAPPSIDIDALPCACLRTSKDGQITFANRYFTQRYDWPVARLIGHPVSLIFSPASRIFCDSFVFPKAMTEPVCPEVQLTVLTSTGQRRPIVASVNRQPDGGHAWVFIEADNRNSLFEELEIARSTLEDQKAVLHDLSRTDGLTGVLNRRAFDAELQQIFKAADRYGQAVSILLMDIDHFKSINDDHGHLVGDQALIALGQVLKKVCRAQDVVARFGGDEFVCVLKNTEIRDAVALAARIHTAVGAALVDAGPFTVSIGVSGRTAQQRLDLPQVLSTVDQALYDAKLAGRNQTSARHPQAGLPVGPV